MRVIAEILTHNVLTGGSMFKAVLAAALVTASTTAYTQAKPYRVGWVISSTEALSVANVAAMRAGLRELGHVEGRSILLDITYLEGRMERFPEQISGALGRGANVLVVGGYQGALMAKKATATVPIVGIGCGVEVLADSLARPGGNLTGVTCQSLELTGKQIQLLRDILPSSRRIAVVHNPTAPYTQQDVRQLSTALGTQMIELHVGSPNDFAAAVAKAREARVDAAVLVPDLMTYANRRALVEQLSASRVPAIASFAEFADAGALMTYGANVPSMVQRSAWHLDRIAKGAKAGELPIVQPTKFDMVINLKTAKAFGITIAPSVLARADKVID
jgi:putative tryptophan/tyrosine transport system substrate-binding protein